MTTLPEGWAPGDAKPDVRNYRIVIDHLFLADQPKSLCGRRQRQAGQEYGSAARPGQECAKCAERQAKRLYTAPTMPKNPPKGFVKYASSPTKEGIQKSITKFFAGESKEMRRRGDTYIHSLHSTTSGKELTMVVVETTRGFYLGVLA